MLEKQDKKIELETARVTVKKRKKDFMILIAYTFNMDEEVKATHTFFREALLIFVGRPRGGNLNVLPRLVLLC
jgi:hypothetical protein